MVNKRAWVRILEVFIAVILIVSAISIFVSTNKKEGKSSFESHIKDIQINVLDEISRKNELRNLALEKKELELRNIIDEDIPDVYEFEIRICNLTEKYCMLQREYPKKDVYVEDRVIVGNLSLFEPVKVRIFMWKKD